MTSETVQALAVSFGGKSRLDKRVCALLGSLAVEGHPTLECRTFSPWQRLVRKGERPEPMLIVSGNAAIAVPKHEPQVFDTMIDELDHGALSELRKIADSHPLVFSKGDVIGAMDMLLHRSEPLNLFIAGTFFKTLNSNSPVQLKVAILPQQSKVARLFMTTAVTEQAFILHYLLNFMTHRGSGRINNILACCLAGLLPAYRTFYETSDGAIRIVEGSGAHAVRANGKTDESTRICLTRAPIDDSIVAVELTTLYLDRCFAFPDEADYAADLRQKDILMCAPARPETIPKSIGDMDNARLMRICGHSKIKRQPWGPESVLFMIRCERNARDFCRRYHVDFDHQLFMPGDLGQTA